MGLNIIDAKLQYKSLYLLRFNDKEAVLFRPLLFNEYRAYRDLLYSFPHLQLDIEESIFIKCVIDGYFPFTHDDITSKLIPNINGVDAGTITVVSHMIMELSGAMTSDKLMEHISEVRESVKSLAEDRLISLLSSHMHLDYKTIESMTWDEILRSLIYTELLLVPELPTTPFQLMSASDTKFDFDKDNRIHA